jgi:hypothetical protein
MTPRTAVAALVALATAAWLIAPAAGITADTQYAIIWGDQLRHGLSPEFGISWAPAPHPLGTVVGAAASLFGEHGAISFMVVIAFLAFAASALLVFDIGRKLFDVPIAAVASGLLLTSSTLWRFTALAAVDMLAFTAILAAVALEVRRPRAGLTVLVVLGVAGFQRPEAWILAGAYWLYLVPTLTPRARVGLAAVAVLPPALWVIVGLASTHEGTYSLQAAQDAGQGGGYSAAEIVRRPLDALRETLRLPALAMSLVGAALALWLRPARARLPVVVAGLVLLALAGLGLFHLYVLARFALVPTAMLCLFFGFAGLGWRSLHSGRGRFVWSVAGTGLAGLILVLSAGIQARDLDEITIDLRVRERVMGDARALERQAVAGPLLHNCEPVYVVKPFAPFLAWNLGRPLRDFSAMPLARARPPRPAETPSRGLILDAKRLQSGRHVSVPASFRRVASHRSVVLYARGC